MFHKWNCYSNKLTYVEILWYNITMDDNGNIHLVLYLIDPPPYKKQKLEMKNGRVYNYTHIGEEDSNDLHKERPYVLRENNAIEIAYLDPNDVVTPFHITCRETGEQKIVHPLIPSVPFQESNKEPSLPSPPQESIKKPTHHNRPRFMM
jgi:hypothetical protein